MSSSQHQNSKRFHTRYTLCFVLAGIISSCYGQDDSSKLLSTDDMLSKIQTDVDPYFQYEFEKTKFVPPDGKTLLIMGQTLEDIDDYMAHFSEKPIPGGWSAYWGIPKFNGITNTFRNENGSSHNHQILVDRFPNTVLNSGLWMTGSWNIAKNAAQGDYDKVIKQYAKWAKSIDRPIYLRIGYEFDGPHNALEPKEYVSAYKRIVDKMRAVGADNIAFVWHSYLFEPYKGYPIDNWYPGDDYVDWIGISLFDLLSQGPDLLKHGEAVMEFAKTHKKPVMAAEASPTSGIVAKDPEVWNNWFVNFFSICYEKNIKAICFINANWEMYSFPGVSWSDARLSNNEIVSNAWFLETSKDRYLKQSEELFEQLGYEK